MRLSRCPSLLVGFVVNSVSIIFPLYIHVGESMLKNTFFPSIIFIKEDYCGAFFILSVFRRL